MILIADSGGTNVEWCLLDGSTPTACFITPGINALMLSPEELQLRLDTEVMPQILSWSQDVNEVYFYGAGCATHNVCELVKNSIHSCLNSATVYVTTDMLAAARALCGDTSGIVCILGTGSNSCYYDGKTILENVPPMGYILGDEGSGAYLGKRLVSDIAKRQMPEWLCNKFYSELDLNITKIIERVYRQPYPNKFLASLTPFIAQNMNEKAVHQLVLDSFVAFLKRNVYLYDRKDLPVHFCGSIASVFSSVLAEAADICGIKLGKISKAPMPGLIKYHSK